jgi:NADPH:quinone reductase-like Zn-dependent oxidoreductase
MVHKAGATVIATTRTRKKRDALLAAGADHVVATDEEDMVARVMEITEGRGADVVYDCVAGALSEKLARAAKVRGHWIVYGFLDALGPFPWWAVGTRGLRFALYIVFAYTGNRNLKLAGNEEAFLRAKQFIGAGIADGSLPGVPIDREFRGLESLPEAMRHVASNQAAGKIVVTPWGGGVRA